MPCWYYLCLCILLVPYETCARVVIGCRVVSQDAKPESFDTQHQDMIHDSQPDYYGRRVATCSSDRTVRIFDIASKQCVGLLQGHDGPVWQVAWAHPKFGNILASCGYDHRVIVWREVAENQWAFVYDYNQHTSSVNSVSFAPHEFGLMFACASSDGAVSIVSFSDNGWRAEKFDAHSMGCNSVSWAPYLRPGSAVAVTDLVNEPFLVTGGCDSFVKIWKINPETLKGQLIDSPLKKHTDWVRDVAWAPNIGLPSSVIASCSQDRSVVIWVQSETDGPWVGKELPKFPAPVWRVSWSITGNILAVSSGDNKVTLWKEVASGDWKLISAVSEAGVTDSVS